VKATAAQSGVPSPRVPPVRAKRLRVSVPLRYSLLQNALRVQPPRVAVWRPARTHVCATAGAARSPSRPYHAHRPPHMGIPLRVSAGARSAMPWHGSRPLSSAVEVATQHEWVGGRTNEVILIGHKTNPTTGTLVIGVGDTDLLVLDTAGTPPTAKASRTLCSASTSPSFRIRHRHTALPWAAYALADVRALANTALRLAESRVPQWWWSCSSWLFLGPASLRCLCLSGIYCNSPLHAWFGLPRHHGRKSHPRTPRGRS
jgi:hypothetical protein